MLSENNKIKEELRSKGVDIDEILNKPITTKGEKATTKDNSEKYKSLGINETEV